jgi:trans-2,3-dihydro-3-hydroxyanthranilate isomerase
VTSDRSRRYAFETLDVFTRRRFGGNPLAVVHDAESLSDAEMQAVAAEFNLSETIFLKRPADPVNTAAVRIFNRTHEMPFAGHPTIGAAVALSWRGAGAGPLRLEAPAGLVVARIGVGDDGRAASAAVVAPQPLSLGPVVDAADVARCLGLGVEDVVTDHHQPRQVSMGTTFILAQVRAEALGRCAPDVAAFRDAVARHPEFAGRFSLHAYARAKGELRARMFAPLAGTFEDPATGSANGPLGGLLLRLSGAAGETFRIAQGVEMGRPSQLTVRAWREDEGIRAEIAGDCVAVMQGEIRV